ncbi:hypothetical protein LEP1GSC050_1538 [Leptospira broomii serovar Hurstbridge str. 5399]|uniref:DUF5683 domain-containing protein n=1 Tax=Leptospira broomii serovar Hurstbridge str. 5399 TaxID=1049789 RepID=T0GA25_9LEPT|nr:hypothetical protein [Leptospira broomii]EQA43649.1 hypothetical protein LEP1GSC050_1538 [Leptospira broomii serovar Hurstbridge str. 5399]
MFAKALNTIRFAILTFALIYSSHLFAMQSILLRNGNTIKGDVITQNEKTIQVRGQDGKIVNVSKRSILKVIYKEVTKDEEKKIRQEEERKVKEEPETVKEEPIIIIPPVPTPVTPSRSRWSVVWRSAVLPGWGHIYAGRKTTGIVYSGLLVSSLGYAAVSAKHAHSAKSDYDQASLTSTLIFGNSSIGLGSIYVSGKKSQYQHDVKEYNNSLAIVGAVYLVQLVHSYFTGGSWAKEDVVLSSDGTPIRNGIQWNAGYDRGASNSSTIGSSSVVGSTGRALYGEFRYSVLF